MCSPQCSPLNPAATPTMPARGRALSCEHNETIILTLSVMTDFLPLQCIYVQNLNSFRPLHVFPFNFMYFRYRVLSRGWALHPIWSPVLRRTDQTNVREWQADSRSSLTVNQQDQPRLWVHTLHPIMVEGSTVTQIRHTSENFSSAASGHGVSIFFPGAVSVKFAEHLSIRRRCREQQKKPCNRTLLCRGSGR